MMYIKLILLLLSFIAQMSLFRFQGSIEGKDERGKEIQYQTNSFLLGIFYIGIILIIILNLLDIISNVIVADVLLYFVVSMSIFGAIYSFWKRKRQ